MNNNNPIQLGVYQHYKGKYYAVVGEVIHSETQEVHVRYIPLYDHEGLPEVVRPKSMFLEYLEIDGKKVPRFQYIAPYRTVVNYTKIPAITHKYLKVLCAIDDLRDCDETILLTGYLMQPDNNA